MNADVAVGSMNPIKILAVKEALEITFPGYCSNITPVSVTSGVSSQPRGNEETLCGAFERARLARELVNASYGIGLEGGIISVGVYNYSIGWVAVVDKSCSMWSAPCTGIMVPNEVMELVNSGLELGDAEDIVFGGKNNKQKGGLHGIVTGNKITRLETFRAPVIAALCSMSVQDLYVGGCV